MSDIIAGSPAPTNLTADSRAYLLLAIAAGASVHAEGAEFLLAEYDALKRAEFVDEAIKAARAEYLTDDTRTADDTAYNNGVADAIAAISDLRGGTR